ncbi:MAG: DNA polymerase III subunit epsilon [Pseudomonadota bacterium]
MREIAMDTETTGLNPDEGHRIVEIGCVELINHVATGAVYHQYINPERDMPTEAFEVHGLSEERLSKEPVFADVGDEFLEFIGDANLVIHNAAFDMRFLNAELGWAKKPLIDTARAIDTLGIARQKFPGAQNSLDALCRRFGIDNSARVLHGALLDSEILAEVYLELIGGKQPDFVMDTGPLPAGNDTTTGEWRPGPRPNALRPRLSEKEKAAHAAFVETLGDEAVWKKIGA